jgi:hypothetical protein
MKNSLKVIWAVSFVLGMTYLLSGCTTLTVDETAGSDTSATEGARSPAFHSNRSRF